MLGSLLEACALQKSEELVSYVHHQASKADIASLAPIVTTFAIQEDPLALAILEQAARELATLIEAVQNPEIRNNELVVAGGVLEHDPIVRPLFETFLAERLEHLVIIERRGTALDGACLLARELER
jgi:N-acetylglucosamine kinase-like BadF-type ATPase